MSRKVSVRHRWIYTRVVRGKSVFAPRFFDRPTMCQQSPIATCYRISVGRYESFKSLLYNARRSAEKRTATPGMNAANANECEIARQKPGATCRGHFSYARGTRNRMREKRNSSAFRARHRTADRKNEHDPAHLCKSRYRLPACDIEKLDAAILLMYTSFSFREEDPNSRLTDISRENYFH